MMPVVLQVRIHERDPELNPQVYYLYFKDEKSKAPLENYLPLRYKKTLSTHWSDDFYKDNCKKIKEDVASLSLMLGNQYVLVVSTEEVTEILAEMEEHCPKTKQFLADKISSLTWDRFHENQF